jgi:hypothetical protein
MQHSNDFLRAGRRRPISFQSLGFLVLSCGIANLGVAQVNVTTYHNDTSRTGENTKETVLTTANVNYGTFGRIFAVNLDGQVYAQPLVLSNVSIGGGTQNVVYLATENDSVYAADANTGAIYWQKSLLENGGEPIPDGDFGFNNNVSPQYGITGTPVIDPVSGTIYVVASDEESGPIAVHRLHALDVTTGLEKFGAPVVIGGSFGGTVFSAEMQFNRPALLLSNGHVIVAFGQHCNQCAYGWVMSYNASTLAEEAVFSPNPGTAAGGIWMGGDGIVTDSEGNLYFSTADGPFDGNTGAPDEYGDSIVKLGPPATPPNGEFPFLDYFAPAVQSYIGQNNIDLDLGSGGVLVLPDLTSGAHPHLLVGVGKEGTIYLADRTNLGKYCGSFTCKDNVVQEILGSGQVVGGLSSNLAGVWGAPAYWNGSVYFGSATKDDPNVGNISDYMKAYSFNAGGSGQLSAVPTSQTPEKFSWPAPNPTISSNGTSNGIVWAVDNSGTVSSSAILHAYNANNLAVELYNSNQVPARDQAGGPVKFAVPTIANGKVYVGGSLIATNFGELTVYGPVKPSAVLTPSIQGWRGYFGSPAVSYPFTLTNATGSTLTISGVSTTNNFFINSSKTTCGATLATLASCTISVGFDFSSQPPGLYTGTLTVTDSASNSPQTSSLHATDTCGRLGC